MTKNALHLSWPLIAAAALLSLCSARAAETYLLTDLGTLGGDTSSALAINRLGFVAGSAQTLSNAFHGVVLSNNVLSDLGTLGGSNSVARALNESAQVAGWSNPEGSQEQRAFLFSNGQMTDLGILLADSTNSVAHGINNLGTVVGEYRGVTGRLRPFVYANGMIPLGFLGAALCINDLGHIGGFEQIGGARYGFIISGVQREYVGTLGSNSTEVTRISTNGLAVGRSLTLDGVFHAFGYQSGIIRDLGTLGGRTSVAYGVNNAGHIVGQAQDKTGASRAFIFRQGRMLDVNEFLPPNSEWVLTVAYGINDTGQIVGEGEVNGKTRGFLLTPNYLSMSLYPGLAITGRVGRTYRVDFLDTMNPTNSWETLTNIVLTSSPYFFVDPRPVIFANRLYRSVLLP